MAPVSMRRSILRAGLCLCCLPSLGSASENVDLQEIAPGIFMRRGPDLEATAANHNGIANIGFMVGRDAVLIVESGGSLADGQWLRSQVRQRTDKPIRHLVMTHMHPDHCLGAAAFDKDRPNVIGHHRLRAALEVRGDFYRERLIALLGEAEVGRIVLPTQGIGADGAEIDLGDRIVRFTAHATAHTDCDLSMIDTATGLLFAADLLFVGRVPSLDGSLLGWLKEVQHLQAMGATKAVPGHGPTVVELAPALSDLERYLTSLRDDTRQAIAEGRPIEEAVLTVALSERGRWNLFDDYHGRNVVQAYKELEWE